MSDRLVRLTDARDRLRDAMDEASAGVLPQIVAQYRATLAEIDDLQGKSEKAGDPVDEIAARRRARGAVTA